ncbi:unnamed protein product, partial [Durusdinium trenchii]
QQKQLWRLQSQENMQSHSVPLLWEECLCQLAMSIESFARYRILPLGMMLLDFLISHCRKFPCQSLCVAGYHFGRQKRNYFLEKKGCDRRKAQELCFWRFGAAKFSL